MSNQIYRRPALFQRDVAEQGPESPVFRCHVDEQHLVANRLESLHLDSDRPADRTLDGLLGRGLQLDDRFRFKRSELPRPGTGQALGRAR